MSAKLFKWNQKTITQWGQETFGPCHPGSIACRMSHEVSELLEAFEVIGETPVDRLQPATLLKLQLECADIAVMLDQIAEQLMADLTHVKNYKMEINAGRRWGWDEEKQQTRHITEFCEEGSKVNMRLDRWYVLSEPGGCYWSVGFETAQQALSWIQRPVQCMIHGHEPKDCGIPRWLPEEKNWDDGTSFFASVMYGRDLYDFQKASDEQFLHPSGVRRKGNTQAG